MTSASGTTPVSFSCGEARDRFAAYLDERLAREERRAVRAHLDDCASCRAEASSQDPAFLFAFVGAGAGAQAVAPEETARILAAVRTGIELKTAERRVGRQGTRRLPRAYGVGAAASVAAAAFVAVLVGSSGVFRASRAVMAPAPAPSVAVSAPASAPEAEKRGPAALVSAEVSESAAPVSPFAEARGPARGQKLPADATIYDWNPGGGQPRVVWIVDRSLDI
ncbi:MAG TPA: zf-HC2 domain-containing protein [Thermoanaerobaculia bacterium]